MALKFPISFPIFTPQLNPSPNPNSFPHRLPGEVRFSRWNNANAEKFEQRRRSQQEIEDQIRRERRFESATRIAEIDDYAAVASTFSSSSSTTKNQTFRSIGTPSSPSLPSIPGKKSKYSKNPKPDSHPAFRHVSKTKSVANTVPVDRPVDRDANVKVSEDGVSYVINGAPFEFKYSYTETPKVKPIKLREAPYTPFGPTTMPRPWTGRAPLPPSKKKLKEFDSFQLPPHNKKGVKPIQAPGPFLPGSGPKYVKSREEILGEPLTEEEIKVLINGCLRSKRQLNMGRDGLTHNMLDNIHALWKRRRVCKIKCKGVCTVDMENVRQQLEEKTGGKIIYSRGGVLYLFRGRNYNYKTRPRFPLMLWKPITPVYPRLIQRAPEGLTLEEASEMRKKGRKLIPVCRLGKNGVYCNLVKEIREAFGVCELVRINCQGMNGSDFRKIGAKLKDLVPCVLISFESEHILMWRGPDWKPPAYKGLEEDDQEGETTSVPTIAVEDSVPPESVVPMGGINEEINIATNRSDDDDEYATRRVISESETVSDGERSDSEEETTEMVGPNSVTEMLQDDITPEESQVLSQRSDESAASTERVLLLLKQAVENGSALILDDSSLDADVIYRRSVDFSRSAPLGPVYHHRPRKVAVKKLEKEEASEDLEGKVTTLSVKKESEKNLGPPVTKRKTDFSAHNLNIAPQGSLGIDELAKLLA